MSPHVYRSISEPIREHLSLADKWEGPDKGLIWCWERGRLRQSEQPELAALAAEGELVVLNWKGGADKATKEPKRGSLQYLAAWQGLRGDDLDIDVDGERVLQCTRTGQVVVFRARRGEDED